MSTDHHRPFGSDLGGRIAERFARSFGTFTFIVAQTVIVALWVTLNIVGIVQHWDPYPFILLNLAFSLQAAYAAPLILLAQTRQAARDAHYAEQQRKHAEEISRGQSRAIAINTRLTQEIHALSVAIHKLLKENS